MLHVLYNNCPKSARKRSIRNVNAAEKRNNGGSSNKSSVDDAWKKDFTKWVPIKEFKLLPESEQKIRKEAIAKAKAERKKNASINSASLDTPSTTNTNTTASDTAVDVPSELEPTFREIMAAKKVERKITADGDTWIRIVKPCREVHMSNLHAVTSDNGGLIESGANTSLQGEDMRMLHQEHGSVAAIGPSNGVETGMDNLSLITCGGVATN